MRGFLLKVAACCALFAWAGVQAHAQAWVEFKSDHGRYAISAPKKPELSAVDVAIPGGKKTVMHQAMVDATERSYLSTYTDYPQDIVARLSIEKMLDNTRNGAAQGHKLRSERRITIAGHPAREYIIDMKEGLIAMSRIVIVQNRLYQLVVVGTKGVETEENTRKYLESFALR